MAIRKKIALISLAIVILLAMRSAYAQDGVALERGEWKHAYMNKVAVEQSWLQDNARLADHDLSSYWEWDVSNLHGSRNDNTPGKTQNVNAVGLTPVIRWSPTRNTLMHAQKTEGFFAEIGIGANYMSSRFNNNGRVMGSCFQFGDHFGIGYQFKNGSELTLKFQHYSNAGISEPNPAVNFAAIKFGVYF